MSKPQLPSVSPGHRLRSLASALALACGGIAAGTAASTAEAVDLMQSYRLALLQDATYQAAQAEAAASREAEPLAQAQLLPNVAINLQRSDNQTHSAAPGAFGDIVHRRQDYLSSNYGITWRQPLYRPYIYAQYQQAHAQVASAEAVLDTRLQELLVRLSETYFQALIAQNQRDLILAQKEAYAAQLHAAKRGFDAGQGTRTDIDDAQARYDMALAQELEANQNVGHTRRQLQVIINQPVDNLASLNPARMQLMPPQPADPEHWIARGEEANAELRALRANIQSAEQDIEKAKAGHKPTLDAVLQRSKTSSENQTTINQQYLTTQVGLQVSIPLFAGGYVSAQIRQAEAVLEKVRRQYEARRREVDQQIRKEYQNVAEGILKVNAMEQAERSADQAVFSNQKGFQAGTRTLIDILNAQQQRMNTRRDLAQVRYLYVMARVRLHGLAGSLNEAEIGAINDWLQTADSGSQAMEKDSIVMIGTLPQRATKRIIHNVNQKTFQPEARDPIEMFSAQKNIFGSMQKVAFSANDTYKLGPTTMAKR